MAEHTDHPPYLGHHYETVEQQFDSGKLGMWLFLATEILLFAGLFCAYAIYRNFHPEIFHYAHQFLNTNLGAINTVILITSSFTMAMAVRTAQLGQRNITALLLGLTLLGGLGFLGIKKVEYEEKWKHGLLWGTKFHLEEHHEAGATGDSHGTDTHAVDSQAVDSQAVDSHAGDPGVSGHAPATTPAPGSEHAADPAGGAGLLAGMEQAAHSAATQAEVVVERSALASAAAQPQGRAAPKEEGAEDAHGAPPANLHIFFGIYFLMTGLHGIHVIAGMAAIGWVLVRTLRGDFSAEYSTPVDLVGLYWHLVDLIWIFLFPLLYLIG